MRVISGLAKGHMLKSPKGLNTRPTADRIKESLFNIIAVYIRGANILDLFAGTGGLGIESLSRGAEFSVFVDKSHEAVKVIYENLFHTKLNENAKVINADWCYYIKNIYDENKKFDIVFMDPPYSKGIVDEALKLIDEKNILTHDGIIVVETDKNDIIPQSIGRLNRIDIREYGRTVITIYGTKD